MTIYFGKNRQVHFANEEELETAIHYILTSDNVNYKVHEDNQDQGAWGSEDRIHFKRREGIPDCLLRNMTRGNGSIFGRINCKEFIDLIKLRAANN